MESNPHVRHVDPEGLHANPAFTNVVVVEAPARTVYIGGQNALTPDGVVVGPGDLAAQTEQALRNLQTALRSVGGDLEHVVKWTIFVVDGQPLHAGFEVSQRVWGERGHPPAITVAVVAALANPEFLVEIDAVAVVSGA